MQSVWIDSVENKNEYKDTLNKNIKTDVLIVGGGMAGLLCAYKLKKKGIECVVVEADTPGMGVTKNTTAKISAQHGLIYDKIIKKHGIDKAKLYYYWNMKAVDDFRNLSKIFPCDFEEKTAYVYSIDNRKKLEKEATAYKKLGIEECFNENPPLPFKTSGALGMLGQAQFNPLKLLNSIASELNIYKNTFVKDIKDNVAITDHGNITAKHIVLATHFPLINIKGLYFLKMYQSRSYVIALKNAIDIKDMYVDECDYGNSFRNYKQLLFVGGGDHRTGKIGGGFNELRQLAKKAYPQAEEEYAWETQDCITLDRVPYIGYHHNANSSMYVATGFNKWGMVGSMLASNLIADLITKGKNEILPVVLPQRSILSPQLFLNLLHALEGWLSFGKRCPHMGCGLKWNENAQTWDCPCHGSRFTKDGNIIDNPAKKGI